MRSRLTEWYITAKRPAFLDDLLSCGNAAKTEKAGLFDILEIFPCPCRVVVCDDLDMNDDNLPLLMLGSIETIKNTIHYLAHATPDLRHAMESIISLIYLFYNDEVKDMTEMNDLLPADIRQNMVHAIEDIGLEIMIEEIGIDKVIDAMGIDKVLDAIGDEKLEKAIARRRAKRKQKKE